MLLDGRGGIRREERFSQPTAVAVVAKDSQGSMRGREGGGLGQ